MVGSEAKNPLPSKVIGNYTCMDVVGLSWLFLDDPILIGITRNQDKMGCESN